MWPIIYVKVVFFLLKRGVTILQNRPETLSQFSRWPPAFLPCISAQDAVTATRDILEG